MVIDPAPEPSPPEPEPSPSPEPGPPAPPPISDMAAKQVIAIFNAAHKKALAGGGGVDANLRALAQASKQAATMLAIELDSLRSRET